MSISELGFSELGFRVKHGLDSLHHYISELGIGNVIGLVALLISNWVFLLS